MCQWRKTPAWVGVETGPASLVTLSLCSPAALTLGPWPRVLIQHPGAFEPCVLMGTSGFGEAGPAGLFALEAMVSRSASPVSEAVAGHGLRSLQPLRLSQLPGLQVGLWGSLRAQPCFQSFQGWQSLLSRRTPRPAPHAGRKHVAPWQRFF